MDLMSLLKLNWKKKLLYLIPVCLFFIFVFISIFIFLGCWQQNVKSYAFAMGNYNRPFLSDEKPDYKVFIEYSSKGAFIAGKKIHAHIEVELIDDSLKKNKFVVIFPDAFNNTFFEEFGSNINNSLSPSVVLQMKDSSLEGDIDLIYFLPNEYKIKIAIDNTPQIPIETNFYPILYNENGVWQLFYHSTSTGNVLIDSKSALHIAPLEEKNQIQYNNNVLILTIWVILLALFQVYLTLLQLNKK